MNCYCNILFSRSQRIQVRSKVYFILTKSQNGCHKKMLMQTHANYSSRNFHARWGSNNKWDFNSNSNTIKLQLKQKLITFSLLAFLLTALFDYLPHSSFVYKNNNKIYIYCKKITPFVLLFINRDWKAGEIERSVREL